MSRHQAPAVLVTTTTRPTDAAGEGTGSDPGHTSPRPPSLRPRGQRYAAFAAVLAIAAAAPAQCSAIGGHGAPGHRQEHRYAQHVFGNTPAEQGCLAQLWDRESGWNADAVNPSSDAYGIPQALPSVHGHPYALGDWKAQIRWGRRYIVRRYGDPCTALAHENAKGWY